MLIKALGPHPRELGFVRGFAVDLAPLFFSFHLLPFCSVSVYRGQAAQERAFIQDLGWGLQVLAIGINNLQTHREAAEDKMQVTPFGAAHE